MMSWVIRNLREFLLGCNYHGQSIFHLVLYFVSLFFTGKLETEGRCEQCDILSHYKISGTEATP